MCSFSQVAKLLMSLATDRTSIRISFQREAKFFVPIFLLDREKDESPFAVSADIVVIVIVCDRDGRWCLTRKVGLNCGASDQSKTVIREFGKSAEIAHQQKLGSGVVASFPMQMNLRRIRIWIEPGESGSHSKSRMFDIFRIISMLRMGLHGERLKERPH